MYEPTTQIISHHQMAVDLHEQTNHSCDTPEARIEALQEVANRLYDMQPLSDMTRSEFIRYYTNERLYLVL